MYQDLVVMEACVVSPFFVSISARTGNERIVKIYKALLRPLMFAPSLLTVYARILTCKS